MASGGTLVLYGPLVFYNVLTRSFEQELVMDESDTDAINFRFRIRITGFLSGLPSAVTGVLPTPGTGDAGQNYLLVHSFMVPRLHFEYRVGAVYDSFGNVANPGVGLVVADPANIQNSTNVNLKDVSNGPKARVLSVTSIASDAAIRVEAEFEINVLHCLADGSTVNTFGFLNNRWSVVDDIDQNFSTTRTFTGTLRLSSSQVNGNTFRSIVVPPLQPGMRRDRMNFAVSEDALNLRYTVVDKEVAFAPPSPATTWSARFSEEFQLANLGYYSHADITLGGDRLVDKQKLIRIAASMAESKFQNGVRLLQPDGSYYIQNITVVDEYSDNASLIHLRATAHRVPVNNDPGRIGLGGKYLGVPIGPLNEISDVVKNYDPRFSRGSRSGEILDLSGPINIVGAFTSYLQSPCVNNFAIAQGIQGTPQQGPAAGGLPTISAVVNNGINDDGSISRIYGNDNNQAMYEYGVMEVHDLTACSRAACPVAVTGTPGSSQQFSLGDYWAEGKPPPTTFNGVVIPELAPPVTVREVTGSMERLNKPPNVPQACDHTGPNGETVKVRSARVSKGNPKPTADGQYLHRVEFNYTYWVLNNIAGAYLGGMASTFWNPWSITPVNKVGPGPAQFNDF